jgi:hypothetical protein
MTTRLELLNGLKSVKEAAQRTAQAQKVTRDEFDALVQENIAAQRAALSKEQNATRADNTFRSVAEAQVQARLRERAQAQLREATAAYTTLRGQFQSAKAEARQIPTEPLISGLEDAALTFGEKALLAEMRRMNQNLGRADAVRRVAAIGSARQLLETLQQAERDGDRLLAASAEETLDVRLQQQARTPGELTEHQELRTELEAQREARIDEATARTFGLVEQELASVQRELQRGADLQAAIDHVGRVAVEAGAA